MLSSFGLKGNRKYDITGIGPIRHLAATIYLKTMYDQYKNMTAWVEFRYNASKQKSLIACSK